ncbi:MAG: hypothetical protein OXE02_14595 [Chloroflexi bacterium]|nr:hypothetical protein [Chloroflexota bacterium]
MSPAMNRFGGWALVIGPLLALGFFLIEPGGLLIDSADSTDAVASITARSANTALTHLTALIVPFGLALLLFGYIVLQAGAIREGGGIGAALLAVVFLGIGMIAWGITQGLNHPISEIDVSSAESLSVGVVLSEVQSACRVVGGLFAAAGFLVLGLSPWMRERSNVMAANGIVLISLVSLAGLIVGLFAVDLRAEGIMVSRACYFVWVAWSVYLGVQLIKSSGNESG